MITHNEGKKFNWDIKVREIKENSWRNCPVPFLCAGLCPPCLFPRLQVSEIHIALLNWPQAKHSENRGTSLAVRRLWLNAELQHDQANTGNANWKILGLSEVLPDYQIQERKGKTRSADTGSIFWYKWRRYNFWDLINAAENTWFWATFWSNSL